MEKERWLSLGSMFASKIARGFMSVHYCTNCVYPNVAANPLLLGQGDVCSGCRVASQKERIDWGKRWQELQDLIDGYRSESNYDVLIPVGGGKDSYYQTHVAVHELGLKPLLVTYHGNNYLPEAEENLLNMRKVFGCDHIVVRPDEELLVKLNRLVFKFHGDMNWHNHCGIETVPIQLAVQYKIPLILWGEHGGLDLGGMFSLSDRIEFTAKYRVEHALHGFDWHDFTDEGIERLGRGDLKEGIVARDLQWAQYPSDEEIDAWVRANVESAYHPSCSCRMGAEDDAMAVVDPQCRVRGIQNLRVVDSSIFPTITNGNLNAPTIMVAERAADLILGREPLVADQADFWIDEQWQTRQRPEQPKR